MLCNIETMNVRQAASQVLSLLTVTAWTLMVWKSIASITNTKSPVVVVSSGSMQPTFHRGDLLFLTLPHNEPIKINDICVFKLPKKPIPIVHRVIKIHQDAKTKKEYILTKGDHNPVDDRGLYGDGQMWIHKENIVGKVTSVLPYVGLSVILMNDYPWVKFTLIGVLGLIAFLHRE